MDVFVVAASVHRKAGGDKSGWVCVSRLLWEPPVGPDRTARALRDCAFPGFPYVCAETVASLQARAGKTPGKLVKKAHVGGVLPPLPCDSRAEFLLRFPKITQWRAMSDKEGGGPAPSAPDADESATGPVPESCHPKIRAVYDYWLSIHPAEGLPGRQHFDPLDIPALLANIYLIDVAPDGAEFTFRLMGTRAEAFFGANYTGQPVRNAYVSDHNSRTYADIAAMLKDRLPRWRRGPTYYVRNRELALVERVYLPLARDAATVDIVLGLVVARALDSDFVC